MPKQCIVEFLSCDRIQHADHGRDGDFLETRIDIARVLFPNHMRPNTGFENCDRVQSRCDTVGSLYIYQTSHRPVTRGQESASPWLSSAGTCPRTSADPRGVPMTQEDCGASICIRVPRSTRHWLTNRPTSANVPHLLPLQGVEALHSTSYTCSQCHASTVTITDLIVDLLHGLTNAWSCIVGILSQILRCGRSNLKRFSPAR